MLFRIACAWYQDVQTTKDFQMRTLVLMELVQSSSLVRSVSCSYRHQEKPVLSGNDANNLEAFLDIFCSKHAVSSSVREHVLQMSFFLEDMLSRSVLRLLRGVNTGFFGVFCQIADVRTAVR